MDLLAEEEKNGSLKQSADAHYVSLHEKLDQADFLSRFDKARKRALQKVLALHLKIESKEALDALADEDELLLFSRITQDMQEDLLKTVFLHTRQLGLSVVRHLGLMWEMNDVVDILQKSHLGCLSGVWSDATHAKVLTRQGCGPGRQYQARYCDYMREAIDGLVMGVCETERFARHKSVGHGDTACVDVIFDDAQYPGQKNNKWGPIPDNMQTTLNDIQSRFLKRSLSLSFLGLSEGILYYELKAQSGPLCGSSARFHHDALKHAIAEHFFGLKLQDASPLAVYGEGT